MNECVEAGVLAEFRAGRRVLILSENLVAARGLLSEWGNRLDGVRVCRSNGGERIEARSGSGEIRFKSVASSLNGLTADVVVFVGYLPSREMRDNAKRVVMASPHAKIIVP